MHNIFKLYFDSNQDKQDKRKQGYQGCQSVTEPFKEFSPPVDTEIVQAEKDPVRTVPEWQTDHSEDESLSKPSSRKSKYTIIG